MTAEQIIAAARSALGVPFVHQGRSTAGMDCAGLVVHVCKTLGIAHVDAVGYSRNPYSGMLESSLDAQPCFERVTTLQPGAVLLMRFSKEPQHLAIFTGDTIIHSYSTVGKVCEHRLADVWAARIVRAYRFVGVES